MNIQGQAALVTGGASGLGEATARELARAGRQGRRARRQPGPGREGRRRDRRQHGRCLACDITNADSMAAAIAKAAARHGPARILMNIAGIGTAKRVVQKDGSAAPLEDFARVVNINLIGTYNMPAAVRRRHARSWRRWKTASAASCCSPPRSRPSTARSASRPTAPPRAGWSRMTLPMARDLAQHGIRVCTIAPGLFPTPLMRSCRKRCSSRWPPRSRSRRAWASRRVRPAGLPYRHQHPPQRRGDPPRWRAAHGAALNAALHFWPVPQGARRQKMKLVRSLIAAAVALTAAGAALADINIGVSLADRPRLRPGHPDEEPVQAVPQGDRRREGQPDHPGRRLRPRQGREQRAPLRHRGQGGPDHRLLPDPGRRRA